MNGRNKVIPYPQERALEDAMFGRGLVPTRIFPLLLPVWEVEVKATVTDGRPYQLIDRYLERGIAEGGLGTRAELAGFFALDVSLVDRAVRVLGAIGHLTEHDGRLALTELGRRSQRDQVCYLIEREDRRKLYFDGFLSRPLTRPYYQASVVTLMSQPEARAATVANAYPRFGMLWTATGFRREALTELANQKIAIVTICRHELRIRRASASSSSICRFTSCAPPTGNGVFIISPTARSVTRPIRN